MSVPDTKHSVTPVVSSSEYSLNSVEDLNACFSQHAFLDSQNINNTKNSNSNINCNNIEEISQDNLRGSFDFKPLLETPKSSLKRTFKIKILKDDNNNNDDP
jgi:hypothetical protein